MYTRTVCAGLALLLAAAPGGASIVFAPHNADAVGDMKDKLDLRPLLPSAITAAIKGGQFDPATHPPSPVYARDPDATLPEPRK